jgi:hypothetical protein
VKILTYKQHKLADEFCEMISNPIINESDETNTVVQGILNKLHRDLKFNWSLVFTFGIGVKVMIPIVDKLIKNGNIKVDCNLENLVLVSLAALTITYLKETKNNTGDAKTTCGCENIDPDCEICQGTGMIDSVVTKSDARTLLEELKLRGIGNGIIQKLVECFKFFGSLLKPLFTNLPKIVTGLIDMLAYTSILLPTMNAILGIIGKYDLTIDTLIGNATAIALGISAFLTKYGFEYLATKFKDKFGFQTTDLDKPGIVSNVDIIDTEEDNLSGTKLIKEQ